jgi:hypothetical protein
MIDLDWYATFCLFYFRAILNYKVILSFELVLMITIGVLFVSAFNPFLYTLFSAAFRWLDSFV